MYVRPQDNIQNDLTEIMYRLRSYFLGNSLPISKVCQCTSSNYLDIIGIEICTTYFKKM